MVCHLKKYIKIDNLALDGRFGVFITDRSSCSSKLLFTCVMYVHIYIYNYVKGVKVFQGLMELCISHVHVV